MRTAVARIVAITTVLLATVNVGYAQTPRLEWEPSPDADIAGYIVYYGTSSSNLTTSVDVGTNTRWALANGNLQPGVRYYFSVAGYNTAGIVSDPSPQVSIDTEPAIAGPQTGLVWQHSSGALAWWAIAGTYQIAGGALNPGRVPDTNWQIVATGDFNGDGVKDLVWQYADGTISTWLMRGNGVLAGRLFEPGTVTDPDWRVVATGDMNRDGNTDLIWRNRRSGAIAVWYMDGTRRTSGVLLSPSTVSELDWEIVGAADFDSDGQTDLLWRHKTKGSLAVWLMNGIVLRAGLSLQPNGVSDLGWRVRAVNDIDGNGKPDLIWQHTDGRIAAWLMDGLAETAGVIFTPASLADPNWRIAGVR